MQPLRRLLLVPFSLAFAACSGGLQGDYVNFSDTEDRVELRGSSGRVAALRGQNIDVWMPRDRKLAGAAGELQAAQQALRQVEMVDVEVTAIDAQTLRLTAEGRGTRLLRIDPQADEILTGGTRKYFRR